MDPEHYDLRQRIINPDGTGRDTGLGLGHDLIAIDAFDAWPVTEPKDPDPLKALEDHVAVIKALRRNIYPLSNTHGYQDVLADALDEAATIVVTNQMLDFVLERMPHVPFGQELTYDMLPFPAGYVVLPRHVYIPVEDEHAQPDIHPRHVLAVFDQGAWVQTGAVLSDNVPPDGPGGYNRILGHNSWATDNTTGDYHSSLNLTPPGEVEQVHNAATGQPAMMSDRGIGYFQIISEEVAAKAIQYVKGFDGRDITYDLRAPLPIYSNGWRYHTSWDPAHREASYVLTQAGEWERRFWLAMFATLNQEVVIDRPHLSRPVLRRTMRDLKRKTIPDVVICDLRTIKRTDKDGREHTDRPKPNWSHRWHVKAHPRTLYRGTPQERVVPVKGHTKGPDWAPLLEKDRVYRLRR